MSDKLSSSPNLIITMKELLDYENIHDIILWYLEQFGYIDEIDDKRIYILLSNETIHMYFDVLNKTRRVYITNNKDILVGSSYDVKFLVYKHTTTNNLNDLPLTCEILDGTITITDCEIDCDGIIIWFTYEIK